METLSSELKAVDPARDVVLHFAKKMTGFSASRTNFGGSGGSQKFKAFCSQADGS